MIFGDYDRGYLRTPEDDDQDSDECVDVREAELFREAEKQDYLDALEEEKKLNKLYNEKLKEKIKVSE